MNVCAAPLGSDVHGDDQLVVGERVPLRADEELGQRQAARAAHARELDLGAARRAAAAARRRRATPCRGCRRSCRGCGSAASRRCATPRRAPAARRASSAHRLGVGERRRRAAASPFSRAQPFSSATSFRLSSASGPRAVEVELDHDVGAALDRQRVGPLGLQPQRLVERARGQHVHGAKRTPRIDSRSTTRLASTRSTSSGKVDRGKREAEVKRMLWLAGLVCSAAVLVWRRLPRPAT